nr:PDZ and LIM domain protein 3 isoform X6 [Danaus plexippus plexippus]XP_032511333.1 PDZ and LIM domain protein 3 isoform X7 [Danaus plexippus plexippus]
MGRMHTFVVTLRRESRDTNWGLRLVGGSDLATPLIVTRVTPGTPAGKELVRGDIIAKIDDYDARDLRHEDAQNLFRNAPKQIKLAVQRDVNRDGHGSAALAPRSPLQSVPPPFRTPSPLPATAWRGPESLPRTPQPFQPQVEGEYRTYILSPESRNDDGVVDESITSQPYRTTPLVLPGAKVRREPGPTESYLRHHPNPAMRAPPHHDLRDTLMKQKVAESVLQRVVGEENKVVHKQFNSPINLYSDQNIANSIRQQTSPLPHKPTVMYDPAKSETYRVLQEQSLGDNVSEVPSPATQIFTPPVAKQKPVPPKPMKQSEAQPSGKQTTFVNSLQEEHIQQSNSFKRLMYHVLGETEF